MRASCYKGAVYSSRGLIRAAHHGNSVSVRAHTCSTGLKDTLTFDSNDLRRKGRETAPLQTLIVPHAARDWATDSMRRLLRDNKHPRGNDSWHRLAHRDGLRRPPAQQLLVIIVQLAVSRISTVQYCTQGNPFAKGLAALRANTPAHRTLNHCTQGRPLNVATDLIDTQVVQGSRRKNTIHFFPVQLRAQAEPAEPKRHEVFGLGLFRERYRNFPGVRARAGENQSPLRSGCKARWHTAKGCGAVGREGPSDLAEVDPNNEAKHKHCDIMIDELHEPALLH